MSSQADKDIRPDRVAIYIRWSTEEQGDGTTLAEQREGCELYVRSQGWFVNPELIFIDDGYSGGSLERPGMNLLRDLAKAGEVDCVVVFKIDRLSRNIVDATQLVLVEWKNRCHLRCVRQPIDTTSETGRMIFSILATFADFERAQISERTFAGRVRRIKEGKAYGGPHVPFGLRATGEPGVRELDPQTAPIVAEMFRKVREERASVFDLITWLTAQGVSPPVGKKWRGNSIRHMLCNPIYAGRLVYGYEPGTKPDNRNRHKPVARKGALVNVEATSVPAIVSPQVFDDVQAIIGERAAFHNKHRRASDGVHLLSGIAKCPCGGGVQVHYSRGQKYYICSNRINYGQAGCNADGGVLLARQVEEGVVTDLMQVFGEHHRRVQAAKRMNAQATRELSSLNGKVEKIQAELDKVAKRMGELRVAASMGDLPLSEWRDLRETLDEKRHGLLAQQAQVQATIGKVNTVNQNERLIVERMQQLDRWAELSPGEQKEMLRDLAERIELFKPKGHRQPYRVHIIWRFMAPDTSQVQQVSDRARGD